MESIGKSAHIDLTTGEIKYYQTSPQLVKKYLGGRGLNMYYLHKYLQPGTDALEPGNPLIIGAGLLTGTLAPNSGRWSVTAKSPESGILGDANCGGFFGAEMRFAGFDRLIITGKAANPTYLYLEDGRIEIRNAAKYWGLNNKDTQLTIKDDLGQDVEIACITRAGENQVRFACIMTGVKNAAGRCGMGAVMGSKNLKALVAKGNSGVKVADVEGLLKTRLELQEYLSNSKINQALGAVGTPILYQFSNVLGTIRTNNSQLNQFVDSINAEEVDKHVDKMLSCFNCLTHCRHRNQFDGEGPEYSTVGLFGANCGIGDAAQVIKLNNLANELGLDTSSAGTIIPWAIELYQKGIIDHSTTGRELAYGDYQLVANLLRDIADRKGFGHLLAESSQAVKIFGAESKNYLMAVKGLPQSDPHDVRYIKSFALGLAVSSRGADHLRNRPTLDILNLSPELKNEVYGAEIDGDPTSYDTKEHMVYFSENIYAVNDSLGLCRFICQGFNSPHLLKYPHYQKLVELATGVAMNREQLEQVGKDIADLERAINMREGVTAKDDTLPPRYFDDPMPLGKTKGHRIEREEFAKMLSRYYRLRGWSQDGLVSPAKIAALTESLAEEEVHGSYENKSCS